VTLVNEEVPDDVEEGYSDEGRYLTILSEFKIIEKLLIENGHNSVSTVNAPILQTGIKVLLKYSSALCVCIYG